MSYYNFNEVIHLCEKYESVCPEDTRLSLYNRWALAESFTGKYDSAIKHFDEALKYSNSESLTLLLLNSKACALGEAGKYSEAISLFNSIKNLQNTPFDRFCWNDNLGYVYSYIDPETALAYYNNAEHYLDNSVLYSERKVRHFCRKARVLTNNPYQQRQTIENALKYTRTDKYYTINLGVANTELGAYYNSLKDYDKAWACFEIADKCFTKLVPEDRRVSYLRLMQSVNHRNSGRFEEACKLLYELYDMQSAMLGDEHLELLPTIRELCATLCEMHAPTEDIAALYSAYVNLREANPQYRLRYDDIMLDITYAQATSKQNNAIEIAFQSLDSSITPYERLKLCEELEVMIGNNDDYESRMAEIIQIVKQSTLESLLAVDSYDAVTISAQLQSIMNGSISKLDDIDSDCEYALALSLFRKGLLFSTKTAVEKTFATNRYIRPKLTRLKGMRAELNFAIAFSDGIKIKELIPAISSHEREMNHSTISDKNIYSSIDKTVDQVICHLSSSDIAIDFVHSEEGSKHYYGAFVIRRNEKPIFIKLFTDDGMAIDGNMVWTKLLPYISSTGDIYSSFGFRFQPAIA